MESMVSGPPLNTTSHHLSVSSWNAPKSLVSAGSPNASELWSPGPYFGQ